MAGFRKYINEHRFINKVNAVVTAIYIPEKEEIKKQWSGVILIEFCGVRRNC